MEELTREADESEAARSVGDFVLGQVHARHATKRTKQLCAPRRETYFGTREVQCDDGTNLASRPPMRLR